MEAYYFDLIVLGCEGAKEFGIWVSHNGRVYAGGCCSVECRADLMKACDLPVGAFHGPTCHFPFQCKGGIIPWGLRNPLLYATMVNKLRTYPESLSTITSFPS